MRNIIINADGKVVLSGENFKGMDIDSACKKYLDLCARTGYLDVDGVDNALNLSVIDGLTQALDVHITEAINDYLTESEILCAVIENYEDRSAFDNKKKENLCCSNKYKLISTILEKDTTQDKELLKKLSEIELIDLVTNTHSTRAFTINEELKSMKQELLEIHKEKYNSHMLKITNNSKREFSNLFDRFQKTSAEKYRLDFSKKYNNWQEDMI